MNKDKGIQTWEYPIAFWPVQSTERTVTSSEASVACLGLISSFLYLLFRNTWATAKLVYRGKENAGI